MKEQQNQIAENKRRKVAFKKEEKFLKDEVLGQGVESSMKDETENKQSLIEKFDEMVQE